MPSVRKNRKSHALSEENYDIDKIFSAIEKQVKKLPENNE